MNRGSRKRGPFEKAGSGARLKPARVPAADGGEKFRVLFKSMTQGVFYRAADGSYVDVNPAALKAFGFTRKDFLAQDPARPGLKAVREDGRPLPPGRHPSMVALRTGKPVRDALVGVIHARTGEVRWLVVNAIPEFRRGEMKPFRVATTFHDVSALKRTEAALRESERNAKFLFDHSIMGITFTYPSGEIRANGAFCDLLGYTPREMSKLRIRDITHPEDWVMSTRIADEITAGKRTSARFVKRYVRKDGTVVWTDIGTVLRRDDRGQPLHFVSVLSDITERVQAEEALMASEQRFRSLFEAMKELVVLHEAVLDGAGRMTSCRILDCNRAFEEAMGVSREKIRGRSAFEFYGSAGPGLFEKVAASLRTGQVANFETFNPGLGRHFSLSAFNVAPGRFATVATDVTERKRMENKLREDEEKYRTLFGTSDEAILLMRGEMFIDCNERSVTMYGCSDKGELIGHTPWEYSPLRQPDGTDSRAKARGYIEAAIAGAPQRFYWRHQKRDGTPFEAEVGLNSLVLDGQVHVQAIVQDIGERKRAEEEIQRSLREKETLLREIYHRTKNNMNVIGAMLSLQSRNFDDEKAVGVFRDIEDKIRVMALVHRKLYESKDLHRIDMRDYVADLVAQLTESHREPTTALDVTLDLEELPVPIDIAIPCGMILNELFSNATKHAFAGASRGNVRIRLARSGDGRGVELDFSDNGTGVPPGFDFRSRPTLGLQTLIMLVEHQLRGSVEFVSNGGLTCRVRFPYRPKDPGESG